MKSIYADPVLGAQRVSAVKMEKRATGKICPEFKDKLIDRRFRRRLCGEKRHNRRTCQRSQSHEKKTPTHRNHHCKLCGQTGHNRRSFISTGLSRINYYHVFASLSSTHASDQDRKVYIVYMGRLVHRNSLSHQMNMLQEVVDGRYLNQSLVRSYTRSFHGFAAYLTPQESEKLAGYEDVVSVFPSTTFRPLTTRSWDFIGLNETTRRNPTVESDTIIGVIDTGIWPESKSFDDKGYGPPPKKWKGECKGGRNFTCNNKVIGARYYHLMNTSDDTARDHDGHGSHTASTAAGNYVKDANFYGIANGTAKGGVPSARIAVYNVCSYGCEAADILAAFDDAIADGVDIITISLGFSGAAFKLEQDHYSIGSFHALEKGILVVQAAGNDNSACAGTVGSISPWIFTVAASNTDRGIISSVSLGDGTILPGNAVNSVVLRPDGIPVVYGTSASRNCSKTEAMVCADDCLDESLVKGKIVLCNDSLSDSEANKKGALGLVLANDAYNVSSVYSLPASALSDKNFDLVEKYVESTRNPKLRILPTECIKNLDAPRVATFSSRGPNLIYPDILKPDITAPGVEILAAYTPVGYPSEKSDDTRSVNYNVLSGTSMACPHVAGAAAYVKTMHPDWSPSAIKSALMTTAWRMDASKNLYASYSIYAEFAYGAGHIDPIKAAHPGLVYETFTDEYIKMLCGAGYNESKLRKIFAENITCPKGVPLMAKDLNYPSMTILVKKLVPFSEKFSRTVTNVGHANSTYKVTTSKVGDYKISVEPSILKFGALHERKKFQVTITGETNQKIAPGWLEWSDGVHIVRSPIVVYTEYDYNCIS